MGAGWAPTFAIIEHVGRRSGKPYRTPVNAFNTEVDGKPGVAVLLSYGPDRASRALSGRGRTMVGALPPVKRGCRNTTGRLLAVTRC